MAFNSLNWSVDICVDVRVCWVAAFNGKTL